MGRIAEALRKSRMDRMAKLRADTPCALPVDLDGTPAEGPGALDALLSVAGTDRWTLPSGGIAHRRRRSPSDAFALPMRSPVNWDVHSAVVVAREPQGVVAEQYRAVRTWLLNRQAGLSHWCLAVTSSVPREGRTLTTANLAVALAEIRHARVLAIDGDLRGRALARVFKLKASAGLADVLAGRATLDEALLSTPAMNLSVLAAGECGDLRPTDVLNSPAAARVFDDVRERFNYILVDTPSILRHSDTGVIGALCSGAMLVVRMHRTPSNLVRQSLHRLQAGNLQVLGCIASGCRGAADRDLFPDDRAEEPL